jgi:hypothetical protein
MFVKSCCFVRLLWVICYEVKFVSELVVDFLGVPKSVSKKGGGMLTKRERFYVWEHEVVGHVLPLEFCPVCDG